jgi:hypothetical protein
LTTDLQIRIIECDVNEEPLSAICVNTGKDRRTAVRFVKRWQEEISLEQKEGQEEREKLWKEITTS